MPDATEPKVAVRSGAPVAGLVPRSIEEAWRLAQYLAKSDMAPKDMKSPEKILVAILGGAEIGLPPYQALQSFAVINGRPTLWGDGLLGVVRARGVRVREWFEGEGENLIAKCEVTRPDTGEVIPGEFSVADAKTAGLWGKQGPWQSYPKRMLKMRARAFAVRDGCADILRGIQVREEVEDYTTLRDVTPPAAQLAIESQADDAEIEVLDEPAPEMVEVTPEADALAKAEPSEVEKWAAKWLAKFSGAENEHQWATVDAQWNNPKAKGVRDQAPGIDAARVAEVSAAYEAARWRFVGEGSE